MQRFHEVKKLFVRALGGCALLCAGGAALAQAGGSLVVPVRVVEGHLMAIGFVTNRAGDVNDLSVELSFEDPGVFTLHGDQYGWLDDAPVVKLLLKPGAEFKFSAAEVKPETRPEREQMQNELTRFHSNKLDEHKAKGTLGAGFFRKYHVVLDVAAGTLALSPLETGAALKGQVVRPFEWRGNRLWMPVQYGAGKTGLMLLGGDAYDTFIDSEVAKSLGKAAGDVTPVWLGGESGIDLSRQMALRPRPLAATGATFVTGVNLLEAFRVEVDWNSSRIAFTPSRQVEYPKGDLAYFQAEIADKPEAFQAYLEQYPATRLSAQAARRLMEGRIKQVGATDEALMQALQWVAKTSVPERQMENCTPYVRAFRAMPGRDALVVQAGLFALQYSRQAVTVQDTYRLHNIIGEAYMKQDKVKEAWKHFLSAAFMPLDNNTDLIHNIAVNYNLACAYDRMGRATRAYSRFVRTQEMLAPLMEQVAGIPADAELSPADRETVEFLKKADATVKEALPRLKAKIPADELEMLEG